MADERKSAAARTRPTSITRLDKITLGELVAAYFAYPAIQVYIALTVICTALALYLAAGPWLIAAAFVGGGLAYPFAWYLVHRFVLHGRFLYRSPYTAALWKRIHYDHHINPNDLQVLFGSLYTTVPTIAVVMAPLGWLIGGPAGAAAALAAGFAMMCLYEFCHCIQHLSFKPKSKYLRRIKKRHMAHHFHYEGGNFGITNFGWDRLFGTLYNDPREVPRSETVFNLGYTAEEAARFPWVAELSPEANFGAASEAGNL